jgi:ABC-type multidrug transport system fused ATPase/permease subunit
MPDDARARKQINYERAWAEARQLVWHHRKSLVVGFALMIVSRLAGFVLPFSSKPLVDRVIGQRELDLLPVIAIAVAVASIVQAITSFGLSQVVSIAAQKAIADMRKSVEAHVLRLPVSYFDSTKSGVLISRIMTDAEGVRNLVGTGLVQLVGGTLTATIALVVLFIMNWQLTSVILVILATFGGMMAFAFGRLRPLFRKRSQINAEVTGRLGESIGGIRTLKVYVAEEREEKVFAEGVDRLFRNVAGTITGISAVSAGSTIIIGTIGVLLIVFGGRAMLDGTMSTGDFIQYILFIGLVAAPLVQIASIGTQISEAFAGLDRIREIRDTPTELEADSTRGVVGTVRGDVTFEDVHFEYNPGQPVLRGVSFHAHAGSTTALVGSSGSGKSTLIGLVMAFNRPQKGRVLIDGKELDSMRLMDYRTNLGVVMQDNFLFDGTIRENIAFSRPDATDEEIAEVGRVAHVDDFVDAFPEKYDTIVGERGVKLSGGQRQRVAIARAILANPRILILDEATSSLDSESEALIRDGLRRLRAGRTTFVIAHRLSTIESADQILVLEHGQIVERGTHTELIALGGRYRQLYDRQYGAEKDLFVNPGEELIAEEAASAGPVSVPLTPPQRL